MLKKQTNKQKTNNGIWKRLEAKKKKESRNKKQIPEAKKWNPEEKNGTRSKTWNVGGKDGIQDQNKKSRSKKMESGYQKKRERNN